MDRNKYNVDEANYPELILLFDTYDISDSLTQVYLEQAGPVVCKNGCSNCCKRPTVPFTEPELIGISWYATEKLTGPVRERLKQRLYDHEQSVECPFLLDDECSVYEVRPLICRQFYVKNRICTPDEDILSDRPNDIVAPIEPIVRASLLRLLDFWPYASAADKETDFDNGVMQDLTAYMHEYDWAELAKAMDAFDRKM